MEFSDWQKYLQPGSQLQTTGRNIFGHEYGPVLVGEAPHVPPDTKIALGDVIDNETYWSPYQ